MKLLIVCNSVIPVFKYGGTQRDIWAQGKEMVDMGHKVVYLVKKGSTCSFAEVIHIDDSKTITEQIKVKPFLQ